MPLPTEALPFPSDEQVPYWQWHHFGGATFCAPAPRVENYGEASLILHGDGHVSEVKVDGQVYDGSLLAMDLSAWEPGSTHTITAAVDYTAAGDYSLDLVTSFAETPETVSETKTASDAAMCTTPTPDPSATPTVAPSPDPSSAPVPTPTQFPTPEPTPTHAPTTDPGTLPKSGSSSGTLLVGGAAAIVAGAGIVASRNVRLKRMENANPERS